MNYYLIINRGEVPQQSTIAEAFAEGILVFAFASTKKVAVKYFIAQK